MAKQTGEVVVVEKQRDKMEKQLRAWKNCWWRGWGREGTGK